MKSTTSAALLAAALLAPLATGQNLLANPSFDAAAGGLSGWGAFGNAFAQASNAPQFVPRSNPNLVSMFGNFSGSFNVSGIFQSFPALPGQSFTMDCWSRHFSGDALTGNGPPNGNWMVMKIAFFDANNTEIGAVEGNILDGLSPTDVWIDNSPITGVAPIGTSSVQALILYLQPAFAGGAGHVDDVVFTGPPTQPTYPGTGEDLAIATGIGGAATSTGVGNDVKQASGGQLLEINVSSPATTFDLMGYWLLGQPFSTGTPPSPIIANVYLDFTRPVAILVGAVAPPFNLPVIAPGSGSSSYFVTPTGFAGTSLMVQGLVFTPSANNGQFAITDGHEIQLR
jgi:hypothetical protein